MTTAEESVPGYEPMLAAYHRAFAAELREIVHSLPIAKGQTVLDMACGDGAYSHWLAECVGADGRVVAVDNNAGCLEIARRASCSFYNIEFLRAPIDSLPFEDETFDLCWCAQSLYSLPDPVEALRRLFRVTKPGGIVAVLESDTLHHVILPWPVELELSVRAAELRDLAEKTETPRKFYVGRQLRSVFRKAGFEDITMQTLAYDRAAPLGPHEHTYFSEYLKDLLKRYAKHLDGPIRRGFELTADGQSNEFLLNDPDLTATCIDQLASGRKPR